MTKHDTKSSEAVRDRPVLESKFGESYDSVVSDYRQSLKRLENTLVLKGLSIREAYKEGFGRIATEFCSLAPGQSKGTKMIAVWNAKRQVAYGAAGWRSVAVKKGDLVDAHDAIGRDEAMVLVGNIKSVNTVNLIPCDLERLYFVEDESDDICARKGVCFLSVDGTFRVLPRVAKRELCPSTDAAAIGLHERTVCVVERGAQVMDDISDDSWCVPWELPPQGSAFPALRIRLRSKGFDVHHHVSPDNTFKLLDVMFGPFYF